MMLLVPCLTVLSDFEGILSGGIFSSAFLGIRRSQLLPGVGQLPPAALFLPGLIKSLGFAVCITLIGCWQGFWPGRAPVDVGPAHHPGRGPVVFVICALDLFFTAINYLVAARVMPSCEAAGRRVCGRFADR
jgi:phospholipid/cholesterol/gamma-HCH transport system permease protein